MPRVYTSQSDPVDFCKKCFPDEQEAIEKYGDIGNGPDGRGNCFEHNADHPPYEGEEYDCELCRKRLNKRDN